MLNANSQPKEALKYKPNLAKNYASNRQNRLTQQELR